LSNSPLQQGWIGVEGKGTLDFLNHKLSNTIEGKSGEFTQACLLSAKGKMVDQVLYNRLDPLIFPMD
jgi:folate-binding Fe-S cluster repair protein YgfZ